MHDWSDVASVAPDGLAVVDAEGRWVQLNATAEELCGAGSAELVGRRRSVPRHDHRCHRRTRPARTTTAPSWLRLGRCRGCGSSPTAPTCSTPARGAGRVLPATARPERHRRRRVARWPAPRPGWSARARCAPPSTPWPASPAGRRPGRGADPQHGRGRLGAAGDGVGRLPRVRGLLRPAARVRPARRPAHDLRGHDRLEPVVVPDRWAALRTDPAWAPLHGYLGRRTGAGSPACRSPSGAGPPACSTPTSRRAGRGHPDPGVLTAMAEQAAVALDHAPPCWRPSASWPAARSASGWPATCTTASCSRPSPSA